MESTPYPTGEGQGVDEGEAGWDLLGWTLITLGVPSFWWKCKGGYWMRGGMKGFLVTGALWVFLLLAYMGIELVRGHSPFAMFTWEPGGKYVTLTVLSVLALGTGVGVASDRVRMRMGRS